MPIYDNPAGRLHALLNELNEQGGAQALSDAWAVVLAVPPEDVELRLSAVGQLVQDIQVSAEASDDPAIAPVVRRNRKEWTDPIFPRTHGLDAQLSKSKPTDESLEALALVASTLHATAPDGVIPDSKTLDGLQDRLEEMLVDLQDARGLSEELKQEITARLLDIQRAIAEVRFGGPDAVARAMEALVGTVAFREPEAFKSPFGRKLCAVLASIWVVFSAAPEAQQSLEAWGEMLPPELASGVGEAALDAADSAAGDSAD